ncbi:MAG: hypothetical protein Q4B43_10825 [Bacteroidota bacterium]|nr:hypothetical protein [Bacteroidota bacterium]
MKRFDLNAMGVQEMSHSEMVKTDGGLGPLIIVPIIAIALATSSCGNTIVKGNNNNVNNEGDKNTGNGNGNKDNGSNNGTNNKQEKK